MIVVVSLLMNSMMMDIVFIAKNIILNRTVPGLWKDINTQIDLNSNKAYEVIMDREYHNYKDLRIMVTDGYEDVEGWHHHEHTDQIVYVICGKLEIIAEGIHNLSNRQSICIPAGMTHKVRAVIPYTKILVIKYRSTGKDIINDIIADYIKE